MQKSIPLTSNTSEGGIAGNERLVNVYPQQSTGNKYAFKLVGTPGLAFFCELPTSPVLGLHKMNDRAFAVTPTKFYEVFNDGTFTELGTVDLSGRVSIANNGNHVVVVDGKKGFYYKASDNSFAEIVAAAFYPAYSVTYQDGYFIFERTGTGQFFLSGLLDVTFAALDYATAEGKPDPVVSVFSDHRELFMFGTETIEVWYNSGASDFPFERNQGAFIEKGCAARHSIAQQNNTIYFVGSDLIVYQMSGYTPIRVSTHAVEQSLKGVDLSTAFAYAYQDDGHMFYVLTIPANNITWCFDISTGSWHIRESYSAMRHRSNNAIYFNSKTLVGDFENGKIYELSRSYYQDHNEPLVREFTLPTLSSGREFFTLDSFELDMSSGVGLISGQGSDPKANLEVSKDGGKSFGLIREANIGKCGEYSARCKWNRCGGVGRSFVLKVTISDPVPLDIGGAWVEVR
jgi:hypothetical protein